jgi:hypothetical protein
VFQILIGVIIASVLLLDISQLVLVPRFTPVSLRLAPILIGKIFWPAYRKIATLLKNETALDFYLAAFGPLAFVFIFVTWLASFIFAFGMIIHGMGNEFFPRIANYSTAFYAAGTSIMTLGFGDIVAVSPSGRLVILIAAATGITLVAIGVSCLFSMRQSLHDRELLVNTFQSRIIPRASAVQLLLNYADLGITGQLASEIHSWEVWTADVLAGHRAFPLLCYFRSGYMCASWITILGIMLDAANLLNTTVDDRRFGNSDFFLQIGSKLVNFFREYLRLQPVENCSITRQEFHDAYVLMEERGYRLHEEDRAFERFLLTHNRYAPAFNALADAFLCRRPEWLETGSPDSPAPSRNSLLDSHYGHN